MGVVVYKARRYRGRHGRSRLTLCVLLDTLKASEGSWSKGRFYTLATLASLGVERLSYSYLKSRLPMLTRWGYLRRKALEPVRGRAVFGYALGVKGERELGRAPEAVFREAVGMVLAAMPHLRMPSSNTDALESEPEPMPTVALEAEPEPERQSDFKPDPATLYCLAMAQAGRVDYLCGYPGRPCALYDAPPAGAVVLGGERAHDWNKTRDYVVGR